MVDWYVDDPDRVADCAHDDEAQADSLAEFYEFSLGCWEGQARTKRDGWQLTLLASVHELRAFLQELSWDLGEVLRRGQSLKF